MRFCISEGFGPRSDVLQVEGPRLAKEEPETFSLEDEKKMLAALKNRPRDAMLVLFMLRPGLRLAEVWTVTIEDIIDTPRAPTPASGRARVQGSRCCWTPPESV